MENTFGMDLEITISMLVYPFEVHATLVKWWPHKMWIMRCRDNMRKWA